MQCMCRKFRNLELSARDLDLAYLEKICTACATRANSCRYRDPLEIKQLIADRRALHGSESRKAATVILQACKKGKATWLQELLSQAAGGNFHAVSYFRRRGGSTPKCMATSSEQGCLNRPWRTFKPFANANSPPGNDTSPERQWPYTWPERVKSRAESFFPGPGRRSYLLDENRQVGRP